MVTGRSCFSPSYSQTQGTELPICAQHAATLNVLGAPRFHPSPGQAGTRLRLCKVSSDLRTAFHKGWKPVHSTLLKYCQRTEMHPIGVDVTTPHIRTAGVHVYKMIIPEAHPLYLDEMYPYLSSS